MSTDNSSPRDSHRSIMKSTSIIAAGTLSSRILGFFRDIILAKILGTGFRADAFFLAFKIPNLFRDMVGEGATNSAVVPVYSEYLVKKERQVFWQFVSVIFVLALMVLSLITITGIALAPAIVRIIAPGFMAHPEKLMMTIRLTKMMFPYLVLIGLTAHSIAILYTFRSFVVPSFSPCLLNISIIISAVISSRTMSEPVYGLAVGVLVGGMLQLFVQMRPLLKTGIKFQRPKTLRHPGALRVGKLLLPRLLGAGVYQLTILIDTFCASLSFIVGAGGISAIYYANRIIQFPMGVFGFAIASAALPTLSGLATTRDFGQLKKTLAFSLENIFFIMFPVSVIIILLAEPVIRILFERGEFNAYSTMITSQALFFYALGLFSFGGIKILVTAFHALQDTKTPVKIAAVCLLLNVVLNFVLMGPMKIGGIALASSIAATLDFVWLFRSLERKLGGINVGFKQFVIKILLASGVTAVFVYLAWEKIPFLPSEGWGGFLKLSLTGFSGIVIYGVVCFYLRIEQARKIWKWISHKK